MMAGSSYSSVDVFLFALTAALSPTLVAAA
jgi:hypothetical protein